MIAWVDGEWLEEGRASVPITDRGFLGADAVFETARLYEGGFFRLERHLERLEQSAAVLRIPLPARSTLRDAAFQLAQRNALSDGSLRITVTRGSGTGSLVVATIAAVSTAWREKAERGWTLVTARVRTPPAMVVPHVVKTTGRIWSLLARQEAADAGADDALLLTVDGHVAEGPTWNVFWRRADVLYTPALETGILDGVTRAEVVALAAPLGLRAEEGVYGRDALDYADEILATMSSVGPVNIRVLDRRPLPKPELGPRLRAAYWAAVAAHVERPAGTEPA